MVDWGSVVKIQYDTCPCKFEFDVAVDAAGNGTRTLKRVLNRCNDHWGTDAETLAAAYADNRLKNMTVSRVKEWSGSMPGWRFNAQRELVLRGIDDAALRGACATLPRVRVE